MNKSRLFAFGCSFTNCIWPTWADIAGKNFDLFENWGQIGGGNSFIFYSLCEAIKKNKICSNDTVAVMWSSISREDRWIAARGWLTPGSIYNQPYYDAKFVENYADPRGYLIRDLATISAAQTILSSIGCNWKFFSMVPFEYHDDSDNKLKCFFKPDKDVTDLYQESIDAICPSVYEVVFKNNWYSRPGFVDIDSVKSSYKACQGKDWPTWNEFLTSGTKNCSRLIRKEIQTQFDFEKKLIRTDNHPTPLEHCEYLQKVWPEVDIDVEWVKNVDSAVLSRQRKKLDSLWQKRYVKRF